MKKKIIALFALVTLFSTVLMFTKPASASTPSDLLNTTQPASPKSSEPGVYDKDGNKMPLVETKQNKSIYQPTTVKRLKASQQYQSEQFSGSGMRYGGYIFTLENTNKAVLTLKKGGFTFFKCLTLDPTSVAGTVDLPLSKSPFTVVHPYNFYFGAYNPVVGSTYNVRAIN